MKNHRLNLVSGAALINAVTVGIASTYSSTATEDMKNGKLNPTSDQISWIGSILPLGAALGGIIAGYLADKIGRKGLMMCNSLPLVVGWLFISYASSVTFVYVGRFITGISCGIICVVTPMYVVEISTPETRGNSGCRFQLFICIGILLSAISGMCLPWNWVAMIGGIVGVVSLFFMLLIPESPRWLLMRNKQADAVHAVDFLYGNSSLPSVNQLVSESLNTESKNLLTWRMVLDSTFYHPALLSIFLMFFQQFSGSNAILYYTVSIFKEASSSLKPTMGNMYVAILMSIFTAITSQSMDIVGRKKSLFISGFFTCLALNGMAVFLFLSAKDSSLKQTLGWVPLFCLLVYISAFSIGLGPIPWLMMSEMSPVRYRSFICGMGTTASWIFVFIITKTFQSFESGLGDYGAYWLYSGFCFSTCIFAFFFLPETKGKTMEEIENHFARGTPRLQPLPELPDL